MYELKDSYFVIYGTQSFIISGAVIVLAVAGFFFFRAKKRNNDSQ